MKTEAELRERLHAYELLCERLREDAAQSGMALNGQYAAAKNATHLLKWALGEMVLYTL